MVTTEGLKQLLLDNDYKRLPQHPDDDTEELWEGPHGHTMIFEEAVKEGLGRCTCCGGTSIGEPSAACFARHEAKDCNCYAAGKQTQDKERDNRAGHSRQQKG